MALRILVVANPDAPHLKSLTRLPEDVTYFASRNPDELRTRAPEADILLNTEFRGDLLGACLAHATKARWMHSLYTGVDGVLTPEVVASPLPLTNGRGVFRVPLGEWTVAAMLHFSYQMRRLIRQQQACEWARFEIETLRGQTLGIIGYGGIGSEAALLAKPFGMRILAMRRRVLEGAPDPVVDQFYPLAQINDMIAASDFVLVATPLTKDTRGLMGKAQFAAMKPTGVFINVGRGPVVDEPALVEALQNGKIRGAALDVFTEEPLSKSSPLWGMENVLLSPHCADNVADFLSLAYNAFFENLDRFRAGQPLEYVVDKHAGY